MSHPLPAATRPAALAFAALTLLASLPGAAVAGQPVWVTLGDDALRLLQAQRPATVSVDEVRVPVTVPGVAGQGLRRAEDRIHVVRVEEEALPALSSAVHDTLNRCGGFVVHDSLSDARDALARARAQGLAATAQAAASKYAINQQALLNPLLAQVQDSQVYATIAQLSAINNRYYTTSGGTTASNTIRDTWQALAAGRSDVTVSQFSHPGWPQKSVILTIQGTVKPKQFVVLGGHMDSILSGGTSETSVAPGADDDASGIASLTEALRVLLASGHRPQRSIQFMAYAAEEVGLRGSAAIAADYASRSRKVTGVLQLDMTNYRGSSQDIYLYTDYTNAQQNDFLARLVSTYQPSLTVGTDRCGYACSDHASWTNRGYVASFPFESSFSQYNPRIHTVNDTLAFSGDQAAHAAKFARLALSYAVELAND